MRMKRRWLWSGMTLLLACSGGDRLRVGHEAQGAGAGGSGGGLHLDGPAGTGRVGGAGGRDALGVDIEDVEDVRIEVITLTCAGDCADVVAVAHGGHPPYSVEWEDGSKSASRRVCPSDSTQYSVRATDTAIDDDEFPYEAQTARAEVTAHVLDCSDAGVTPDGGSVEPSPVYWTTWTSVALGSPGTASGTLSPPGGDITVSYSGEVADGSAITGEPSISGIATVTFTPEATYLSATVSHGPPPSGMIGFYNANLAETITFSEPVRDPLIAVITLGNFGFPTTMTFEGAEPEVLSSGPGVFDQDGTLTASGNDVVGNEGNGVVQLSGVFSSFTVIVGGAAGDFAALTVGIRGRE